MAAMPGNFTRRPRHAPPMILSSLRARGMRVEARVCERCFLGVLRAIS
jgi:hypothetical protein